ncbi:hypothetical protein [Capillimicrobium parvum]|uniref:Uncharacterized protein n=1 Tax=Capillimicrobium parvum TaxID=2884022 RepID=A0A9E6XV44_9ACTN|nr:hypothetical protein [Capillimicrobium parvum]UGS35030.1 hypothetical protein DSM104329_01414 [Capillimicrobium parvum]
MSPLKLSPHTRIHALGGLLIVALAAATSLVVMSTNLHNPGTRSALLLGGVVVTGAMLLVEDGDRTLGAYVLAFLLSFVVFALVLA